MVPQSELQNECAFADLGFDSLLSLQILGKLCKSLDLDLPGNVFVNCETIGDLKDTWTRPLEMKTHHRFQLHLHWTLLLQHRLSFGTRTKNTSSRKYRLYHHRPPFKKSNRNFQGTLRLCFPERQFQGRWVFLCRRWLDQRNPITKCIPIRSAMSFMQVGQLSSISVKLLNKAFSVLIAVRNPCLYSCKVPAGVLLLPIRPSRPTSFTPKIPSHRKRSQITVTLQILPDVIYTIL